MQTTPAARQRSRRLKLELKGYVPFSMWVPATDRPSWNGVRRAVLKGMVIEGLQVRFRNGTVGTVPLRRL